MLIYLSTSRLLLTNSYNVCKKSWGSRYRHGARGTPDMRVVALLICWSLPLLAIGGSGQAPPLFAGATADADMQLAPAMIQRPIETEFPGDLGKVTLGSSCWDEEDSLDDHLMDGGLWSGLLRWASVRDHGSWFAHPQCDLVRSPSHTLPLRC
jgi:hypothetical protein